jgi:hypothetical protein
MSTLITLLGTPGLAPPLPATEGGTLAAALGDLTSMQVYPASLAATGGAFFFLGRRPDLRKTLGVIFQGDNLSAAGFAGEERTIGLEGQELTLKICPTDHRNTTALRKALPYTAPETLGVRKSIGCGDRLGLATPGHIRAVRGTGVAPIFAQQSIREMARTQRTPQQVMDDATWGVFREGWRKGFGSDADHLKATGDIDACADAGFTLFTIDPGEYVDNSAATDSLDTLTRKVEGLPWADLESSPQATRAAFLRKEYDLGEGLRLSFSEEELLRAAAKYGRAVAHTTRMYRHLAARMGDRPFELEVSVDETETPTTACEHCYVASELKRLGVSWVGLAPRFVGRFEKGVDYIGDKAEFEAEFIKHVAIARYFGPYKLSLHSGSDKFSIYPIAARCAGELVHLKTAGTSYLEALRTIADTDPPLFREILAFAFKHYEQDRASYHVSADPTKLPGPAHYADADLAGVLALFEGRQLLHVTFGSVLTAQDVDGRPRFRDRLLAALARDEEAYYATLEAHFQRHLAAFARGAKGSPL